MKYRALDAQDDYVLGDGGRFLANSPAAVAQAVKTRLRIFTGEWFLDLTEGLDQSHILGVRTQSTRDVEVQQRILGTKGVRAITQYSSSVDSITRAFTVSAILDTIYGPAPVTINGSF